MGELLRQENDGHDIGEQQSGMRQQWARPRCQRAVASVGVGGNLFMSRIGAKPEVATMPPGLHGEECGIQAQPHNHEKDVLLMGQGWARCGLGVIRHN